MHATCAPAFVAMDFGRATAVTRPPRPHPRRAGDALPADSVVAEGRDAAVAARRVARLGSKDRAQDGSLPRSSAGEPPESIASASPEELRERLISIQRRLGKEGVRVSSLEASLQKERGRVADLTSELVDAKAIPRADWRRRMSAADGSDGLPEEISQVEERLERRARTLQQECRQRELSFEAEVRSRDAELATQGGESFEERLQVAHEEAQRVRSRLELELEKSRLLEAGQFAREEEGRRADAERFAQERFCEERAMSELRARERAHSEAEVSSDRAERMLSDLQTRWAEAQTKLEQRLAESDAEVRAACDRRLVEVHEQLTSELVAVAAARAEEAERAEVNRCREELLAADFNQRLASQEATLRSELSDQQAKLAVAQRYHRLEEDEVASHASAADVLQAARQQAEERAARAEAQQLALEGELELVYGKLDALAQQHSCELDELHAARQRDEAQAVRANLEAGQAAAALSCAEQQLEMAVLKREEEASALRCELVEFRKPPKTPTTPQTAAIEVQTDAPAATPDASGAEARRLLGEAHKMAAENTQVSAKLEQAHRMLEQLQEDLDAAKYESRVLREKAEVDAAHHKLQQLRSRDQSGELEQMRQFLEKAHQENTDLREQLLSQSLLEGAQKEARALCGKPGASDSGEAEELRQLLELAHDENKELQARVEQQAEEITLLESSVLGALDGIRDSDSTARRWGVAGSLLGGKAGGSQAAGGPAGGPGHRTRSLPSSATRASAEARGATPPRKPGDIRRVPQTKSGPGGIVKMPRAASP